MSSTDKEPEATSPGDEEALESPSEATAEATPDAPSAPAADPQPAPAAEPPPAPVAAPAPRPSRGPAIVAWLALLLVFATGAAGYWYYMQAQLREEQLVNRIGLLQAQVEAQDKVVQGFDTQRIDDARNRAMDRLGDDLDKQVQREIRNLRQEFQGRENQVQALDDQLTALKSAVDLQRQELAQLGAVDQQDWSFAEARYLLRLAHQRLIMTGDVASAEALMASADGILRELDDAALHSVRGAVAQDIAALRAVPRIDTEGLYLKLSALISQTERLVIFRLEDVETVVAEGEEQSWQDRLEAGYEAGLDKLSSYIVIRRRDVPYEALMDPQWESLVRQNMRMLLEQAQVALLSGDQTTYRESLRRAAHWAGEFFSADDPATQALVNEMNALADEVVAVDLPDINASLREMDAALDRRLRERNSG